MIRAVGGDVDESGRETRNHELILVGAELWILVEPLQSSMYSFRTLKSAYEKMPKTSRTPTRMSTLHRSSQVAWCEETELSTLGVLKAKSWAKAWERRRLPGWIANELL